MQPTISRAVVLYALSASFSGSEATGHEPDQFTVPKGKEFADLGGFWNNMLYDAICRSVEKVNAAIDRDQHIPLATLRELRLNRLRSPDAVAWQVRLRFPSSFWAIEDLEVRLRVGKERTKHPGKILVHRAGLLGSIYSHVPLIPDPRQINRVAVLRCSTIKVHGTYLGTDKIAHFIGMGYLYYGGYRRAIRAGKTHQQAMRAAQTIGRVGPLSETGLVGYLPTGVFSNADMASNYLGLKFFVNLTEPVKLKGRWYPPMLQRRDGLWTIRPHVRPDGKLFAAFISDHFDEVLNPGLYEPGMRSQVRGAIKRRSKEVLDWYAGGDPRKRNPAYFDRLLIEYATYYGEDYGHSGHRENLLTVGNTCFEDAGPAGPDHSALVRRLPPTAQVAAPRSPALVGRRNERRVY